MVSFVRRGVVNLTGVCTYNAEGLDQTIGAINAGDIKPMIENPKEWIFDKLTEGKEFKLFGLNIKKEKAFEMEEKPDGYESFIREANSIKENQIDRIFSERRSLCSSAFELVNNEVQLKKTVSDKIECSCQFWAETPKQIAYHNEVVKIKEAMEAIKKLNGGYFHTVEFVKEAFDWDMGTSLEINPHFITKRQ